jgi:S1-C subfamily serine protease
LLGLCGVAIGLSYGCAKQMPFGQAPEPVQMAESGYIALEVWTPWLLHLQGSAVIIFDGVGVSNRHLLENVAWSKGIIANNISIPMDNIVLIDTLDLAVFDVPCGRGSPMHWNRQTQVLNGQTIYALGTTNGTPNFKGVVINRSFKQHHLDVVVPKAGKDPKSGLSITSGFLYRGETSKGFSGGPVLDNMGELVGINQGRISKFSPNTKLGKALVFGEIFGFAYHINDVITAVMNKAPGKIMRCSFNQINSTDNTYK